MNDMLSQEEIDALLGGSSTEVESEHIEYNFTDVEKDAIGEVGNISMGTAATTLSTLLGHKVNITTPRVSIVTMQELTEQYPIPFIAVEVMYKEGIEGSNLLIIKTEDVKVITDLMMGGDGKATDEPLTELHLSAISEAMNQMVGSSSTSLSEMFAKKIDINPPRAFELDLQSEIDHEFFAYSDSKMVKIAFNMKIENLVDSEIMQLIPLDFAKEMVELLMYSPDDNKGHSIETTSVQTITEYNDIIEEERINERVVASDSGYTMSQPIQQDYKPAPQPHYKEAIRESKINVQPVQFQSFDQESHRGVPENIALIQDVPLKVTVELGRTVKKINEVLEFAPGTIIELDKLVGEPLDILVNGQYVAKGEVVVIDENYGMRITDIINTGKNLTNI